MESREVVTYPVAPSRQPVPCIEDVTASTTDVSPTQGIREELEFATMSRSVAILCEAKAVMELEDAEAMPSVVLPVPD